jgi:hypothetical protein
MPQIPVKVERLEESLGKLMDSAAAQAFVDAHPLFARGYLYQGVQTRGDSALVIAQLVRQAKDSIMDTLRRDIVRIFPKVEPLQGDLASLFGHIRASFPSFEPPKKIYTLTSGFTVDLLYIDSLLLIGLEHFTPDTAYYQPPEIPRYFRDRRRPNTIVPGLAALISDRYIKTAFSPEQAMVEEMIRWGKVLYFQRQTLPCLPDTLLYGYPAETLGDVTKNAKVIYGHFVDKGLFFSTDHLLRSKYVGERPSIPEIGDNCPGRIGQWMGYQIVAKWAKDKKRSLPEVLAEPDGRKIFNEARWKPE